MTRPGRALTLLVVSFCACHGAEHPQASPELLAVEAKLGGARIFGKPGEYIVSSPEQYLACLSYIKAGLIQRCELAGNAQSAVIPTKPGLAQQFPRYADLFVEDFGARVPVGPMGSP